MKKRNPSNFLARECIATALIQLASQKPFSAITVSELTQRAGVSRMTFYRNYASKEDVFKNYLEDLTAAYREEIHRNGPPETFGEYEILCHCFRYFEAYQNFIRCPLHIGMGELLLNALSSHLMESYYIGKKADPRLYYALQAYAGALYNIYITWLKNGMKEPAETMAGIVYRLVDSQKKQVSLLSLQT